MREVQTVSKKLSGGIFHKCAFFSIPCACSKSKRRRSGLSPLPSACRKNQIFPRSGILKSVFCLSSAEVKNTSIRASVRFVGKADKPCALRGCSAEKSQRDFFDGLGERFITAPFFIQQASFLYRTSRGADRRTASDFSVLRSSYVLLSSISTSAGKCR